MSGTEDITAIIPFHNSATNSTYLHSLLCSVSSQRFMIVVICDAIEQSEFDDLVIKYSERPKIKFLHVNYRSAAKARNEGLAEADSSWVVFWDCDDKVDENQYLNVLDDRSKANSDLIVGQISAFDSKSNTIVSTSHTDSLLNLATYPAFTRIIYKRDFIAKLRFPEIALCEDQCFLALLISKNPKIVFTKENFYFYRVNNTFQSSNTLFSIESHLKAIRFIFEIQPQLLSRNGTKALQIIVFRMLVSIFTRLKFSSSKYAPELLKYLFKIFFNHPWLYKYSRPMIEKLDCQKKLPTLILSGGLGNQIFQYSFMVSKFLNQNFQLNGNLGNPRVSKSGYPDLFSFNVPEKVIFTKNAFWVKSQISSLLLKLSSYGNRNLVSKVLFRGIQLVNQIFAKLNSGVGLIFLANGIGFFEENELEMRQFKYYIGCFHSFVWPEKIEINHLRALLTLREESEWLLAFREQFSNRQIGIVHIRRGDYLKIKNLGYLTLEYFEEQMTRALEIGLVTEFLVFSDDPSYIQFNMKSNLLKNSVIIEQNHEDAATNLISFTSGHYFVLSNSTFSWWGAFLSSDQTKEVVAPKYWYADKRSPKYIYPDSWTLCEPK